MAKQAPKTHGKWEATLKDLRAAKKRIDTVEDRLDTIETAMRGGPLPVFRKRSRKSR